MIKISKEQPKKVHFIGILSNADESIVNFKFDKDIHATFKFQFEEFLSKMSGTPLKELEKNLKRKHFRGLFLSSSFEINFKSDYKIQRAYEFVENVVKYDNEIIDYLEPLFRKMRLYKAGNIWLSDRYYYIIEKGYPKIYHTTKDDRFIAAELYHIKDNEIGTLRHFLDNFDLHFKDKSMNLAFENFELSYYVPFLNLQFLSLMNALEVLLKPANAQTDLTYRLSRNAAVLLGNDKDHSNEIYKNLKCLYSIRSSIVHSAEAKECKKKGKILNREQMEEKIIILREYVRDSIKEMNHILQKENKNKDEILKRLNEYGFGERPWHKD